ncbi:MAG: mechanosensitive ion channel domain-containing protein [Victivallales bacterium]
MDGTFETTFSLTADFNKMMEHFLTQTIDYLPKIGIALMIILVFIGIAKIVQMIFFRIDHRFDVGKNHVLKLSGKAIKFLIMGIGAITALGTLGINVNAMVAGLGLGGFALGFALKDALSNLLSGALILIYHPFTVGDRITVTGCQGIVLEINLRYTILQGENRIYLIPNSSLFTNNIEVLNK